MAQLTLNGIVDGFLGVVSKCNTMFTDLYTNFKKIVATITTNTSNYVLQLSDTGTKILMNVATSNTVTIPPHASVNFACGTSIEIYQFGAGVTSLVAGAGVTIDAPNGLSLNGQYTVMVLLQISTDVWMAVPFGLTFTPQNTANIIVNATGLNPSATDAQYPSGLLMYNQITNLTNQINAVNALSLAGLVLP
jgi:hypothetical protein